MLPTSNLEPLQHSDPNGIIVHPSSLLNIDHDCYTLRKALIAILATDNGILKNCTVANIAIKAFLRV